MRCAAGGSALLPRGRLLVMPGGHHLHMQQPDAVAGAIHEFLMA